MIRRGKEVQNLTGNRFDTMLEFSDWRFSAAAVGLMRYFDFCKEYKNIEKNYATEFEEIIKSESGDISIIRKDVLLYNKEDIILDDEKNLNDYLDFVEHYFSEKMHNKKICDILQKKDISDDDKKEIDEILKANTIMKKVFKGVKYSEENKSEIQNRLEKYRYDIISETYKNGKSTYGNFCNKNSFGAEDKEVCRLLGYYVDLPKKKKSMAFNWDYSTFVYSDYPEFDYVPFAFSRTREAFFINNNSQTNNLKKTNDNLNSEFFRDGKDNADSENSRKSLFLTSSKAAQYVDYQVEIIIKNRDKDYFETMYVRRSPIEVFKKIREMSSKEEGKYIIESLDRPCRYGKDDYINIVNEVVDAVINQVHLDYLIDMLLKDMNKHKSLIYSLIRINTLIYSMEEKEREEKLMNISNFKAKATAEKVVLKLGKEKENKIVSYRNKLISSLTFKDYDRFCTVLLQLSAYSDVDFDFAYNLFDDFEANKNIAYSFVNALKVRDEKTNKDENK